MAVKTQLTKIYYRTGSSGTYALAAIPGVTGIPVAAPSATKIDTSDLDSTAKEYLTGLVDNGSFSLPFNFITFGQTGAAAQAAFLAQTVGASTTYVVALADGTVAPTIHVTTGVITYDTGRSHLTFTGVFGGQGKTIQTDDAVRGTAEITISGAITENLKSA
jgi:hypothetical protein